MAGKHKTVQQYRLYMGYRKMGDSQEKAAAKVGISLSSAKRLEKDGILPSPRDYRTRTDPFEIVWDAEIIPMLKNIPTLSAITLLEYLQDKYPGKYPDNLLRSMQRKVKQWKALNGENKEVMFAQKQVPGLLGLSDFTTLKGVTITINKIVFKHILYHFRLAYSGWSYIKVIQGGESFTALAESLQNALWRLGGAPREHRTDSLSAAFKNLTRDEQEDITKKYSELCQHYGIKPTRNNLGRKHENGSIESSHGHMKRRIKQALAIRGTNDFQSIEIYQLFIDDIAQKYNKKNYETIKFERQSLLNLPLTKTCDYIQMTAMVMSTSTIRIKNVVYSVPSRLIGENIRVHLYDNRLECYLGADYLFDFPRLHTKRGEIKKLIDYKHLIHSLSQKPGAFGRSSIKESILPSLDYQDVWKFLEARCERQQACKIIVGILQLAAETGKEKEIGLYAKAIILANKIPYLELLRKHFKEQRHNQNVIDLKVEQHDLKSYNSLLSSKEIDYASGS